MADRHRGVVMTWVAFIKKVAALSSWRWRPPIPLPGLGRNRLRYPVYFHFSGKKFESGRSKALEFVLSGTTANTRPSFEKSKDILIAQFDSKPDADDIHAQAALGAMLAHPDLAGVNFYAVSGAIGIQSGKFIDSRTLFTMAFGAENSRWTDAMANWEASVTRIRDKTKPILEAGGKVWVQEAGQSDITRDWIAALITAGVSEAVIKSNVIVVQHSKWNEDQTTSADLSYVRSKTDYRAIDDGNADSGDYSSRAYRGDVTPKYVSSATSWRTSAKAAGNPNATARELWTEADRIIVASGFNAGYSEIPGGGVDFSDCVENWWIFNIGSGADSVATFWDRYVVNTASTALVNPPVGRIAVVSDGNSPDPDDIGAKAVMLGILGGANLRDRLVHFSHSCDLDPFSNPGNQTIDAPNELRRQNKLHALSGEGIGFFGPFPNLRNYYNCRSNQIGAVNDLRDAINASTAQDPLWIIEGGEPDIIGFALEAATASKRQFVHVISHHPANDNSGDSFTWAQILAFGVTEHQIGDQNVGLQVLISTGLWDWAQNHPRPEIAWIWDQLKYAEQDRVVAFQANKFDCSDAGMMYWWITGAANGGNKVSTPVEIKAMLLRDSAAEEASGILPGL